jgi:hypothetical protein
MSRPDWKRELVKAWRLASAPFRRLPDFLIPGAPKCGTSSLFDLITLHPDAKRGWRKEPTNFIHYPTSSLRARMNQPFRIGRALCGDGSVEYFFHPDAPSNAASVVPGARLIFLLRDPVARAWSEYRMFKKSGHEMQDFTSTIRQAVEWMSQSGLQPLVESCSRNSHNPVRYVRCGMYAELLANWERAFPRERMLVLFSEDYFSNPESVAGRVYSFLDLRPHKPASFPHARDGGSGNPPPHEAVSLLQEFYRPHNQRLREYLKSDLPWE